MTRPHVLLAGALILLFLGLSFNAYACLVPLYGAATVTMGSDCSSPEEQSARQFCDAFKTLGVQASNEPQQAIDYQAFCPVDTASLSLLFSLTTGGSRVSAHPADGSPQDLLVKTTVLRL
ncbi:MAG: hypothetical protein ACREI2_11445 [Nitrospiraceae bacterium]